MSKFIKLHSESGSEKLINPNHITMVDLIGKKPRINLTTGNCVTVKESMKQIEIMLNGVSKKPVRKKIPTGRTRI